MLNKKKLQKKIQTSIIVGFIIGFILIFMQLITSYNSMISNEYLRYRMFRLAVLSLQSLLYKWLMIMIATSFVFIAIGPLGKFLLSTKLKGKIKTKRTLEKILGITGYLVFLFFVQRSMNLPGPFHPISICVYIGFLFFTAFFWWIFTKTRWWKLFTQSRITTIKRIIYIPVMALVASCVAISISNKFYAPKGPNIVLIGIDTLRADHLSCYLYTRETSPTIDTLAKTGILFSKCLSPIPLTTPSFSSLFTSKRPISHGVLDNYYNDYKLDNRHITLSEVLKNANYNTAAFVSGWTLNKPANLTQGFNVYNDDFKKGSWGYRKAEKVNEHVFQWLEENKNDRFFLFIHYFDPHGRYQPDPPYDRYFNYTTEEGDLTKIPDYQRQGAIADPSYYIAQYDGEIRYTDYHIGQVLEKLSQLGLDDETMIIITADHGETMAEHLRWFDHGNFLYEEQVHVPLIIWYPKMLRPKIINALVRLVDIFPTILDFLGNHFSKSIEGQSLLPLIRGEVVIDADMYHESGPGAPDKNKDVIKGIRGKQFAIRSNNWKLIRTRKTTGLYYELYNLNEDPKESSNLIGTNPVIEVPLKKKLEKFISMYENSPYLLKTTNTLSHKEEIEDKKLKEILKSLGYIR